MSGRFYHLPLRRKLAMAFALVGLVSAIVVASVGWIDGRQALDASVRDELAGAREATASQVESFLSQRHDEIVLLARDPVVRRAAVEFTAAVDDLGAAEDAPRLGPTEQRALSDFYSDEFLPALGLALGRSVRNENFVPADPGTRYLQYHYVVDNPYAPGEKRRRGAARDTSAYTVAHTEHHPWLRAAMERLGLANLHLVSSETETVVYSVEKDTALGTRLGSGPFRRTGLAAVSALVRSDPEPGRARMSDLAPYEPGLGRPSLFLGTVISISEGDGALLVAELPLDRVNEVMTADGRWEEVGLGETGETFLVGPDRLLRSESRLALEDPASYRARLAEIGTEPVLLDRLDRLGTGVLLQEVATEVVDEAFDGSEPQRVESGSLGWQVLTTAERVSVPDVEWVVVAERRTSEARAEVSAFRFQVIATVVGLAIAALLVAWLLGRRLSRPLVELTAAARRVRGGDLDVTIDRQESDEFGELAESFDALVATLRAQGEEIEQNRLDQRGLLAGIAPDSVLDAMADGVRPEPSADDGEVIVDLAVEGYDELTSERAADEAAALLTELVEGLGACADDHAMEELRATGSRLVFRPRHRESDEPEPDRRAEEVAADFAIGAISTIRRFGLDRGLLIDGRAGIASGHVIRGVVGALRATYAAWGPARERAHELRIGATSGTLAVDGRVGEVLSQASAAYAHDLEPAPDASMWTIAVPEVEALEDDDGPTGEAATGDEASGLTAPDEIRLDEEGALDAGHHDIGTS